MAADIVVQALEGMSFPCDRAQLLEYARQNNLDEETLEVLKAIPDGSYRDLGELFTALPGLPPQWREEMAANDVDLQGEDLPPLPAPLEWWFNGWRQAVLPWDAAAQCLRGSVESWPQWLRMTRHIWFPWSKE